MDAKRRAALRAQGSRLKPQAYVGRDGITDAVIQECGRQLEARELVKVRVQRGCEMDRTAVARELGERTNSHWYTVTGSNILLYREMPGERDAGLPRRK